MNWNFYPQEIQIIAEGLEEALLILRLPDERVLSDRAHVASDRAAHLCERQQRTQVRACRLRERLLDQVTDLEDAFGWGDGRGSGRSRGRGQG